MKHLKTFEVFETIGYSELTDELWDDISDILLDLADDGFIISKDIDDVKKVENKLCEDVIEIVIDKQQNKFLFQDIENPVRRLIEYMMERNWNYSLMVFNVYSFCEFECGGPHPLAKVRDDFKNQTEKMLHWSLVDKIVKGDCTSFKIAFYQNIDHVILKNTYSEK